MGYLIDPPERVEGRFVAVFAQTGVADALAVTYLRDNGIDAREFPQMGDLGAGALSGIVGSSSLFGAAALICVPEAQADQALDLLEFESGLVEFDEDGDEDDIVGP
jgi:hypothetical protein